MKIINKIPIMTFKELKNLLSKEAHKNLLEFMKGQTCLNEGIYIWDFERWLEQFGGKKDE